MPRDTPQSKIAHLGNAFLAQLGTFCGAGLLMAMLAFESGLLPSFIIGLVFAILFALTEHVMSTHLWQSNARNRRTAATTFTPRISLVNTQNTVQTPVYGIPNEEQNLDAGISEAFSHEDSEYLSTRLSRLLTRIAPPTMIAVKASTVALTTYLLQMIMRGAVDLESGPDWAVPLGVAAGAACFSLNFSFIPATARKYLGMASSGLCLSGVVLWMLHGRSAGTDVMGTYVFRGHELLLATSGAALLIFNNSRRTDVQSLLAAGQQRFGVWISTGAVATIFSLCSGLAVWQSSGLAGVSGMLAPQMRSYWRATLARLLCALGMAMDIGTLAIDTEVIVSRCGFYRGRACGFIVSMLSTMVPSAVFYFCEGLAQWQVLRGGVFVEYAMVAFAALVLPFIAMFTQSKSARRSHWCLTAATLVFLIAIAMPFIFLSISMCEGWSGRERVRDYVSLNTQSDAISEASTVPFSATSLTTMPSTSVGSSTMIMTDEPVVSTTVLDTAMTDSLMTTTGALATEDDAVAPAAYVMPINNPFNWLRPESQPIQNFKHISQKGLDDMIDRFVHREDHQRVVDYVE